MREFFKKIPTIQYEGARSGNPLAFKFYNPDEIVGGKPMREHLPFAMSWWHTLGYCGADLFGVGTSDKSFGEAEGTLKHSMAKVDAGFELMDKLGIGYFCFHDADLIHMTNDIAENSEKLDRISDYILEKMKASGKKLLWGTANLFSDPRYKNGAGSSNSPEVICFAAAQIKKALEITVKLGGKGYVFWGGREGYDTLWNTDVLLEEQNIASLLKMSVDYGRKIGFDGDFYIEPKPKEPMKHQYDFDAATSIGFLRKYGLDGDFKLNIEANHATLAGHTFEHELRIAAINGMLGSIDANQGDLLLGWDTDEFPFNIYSTTAAMYEVLRAGGLSKGGLNFDAKTRRASNSIEDLFHAYILGMDSFALGLRCAVAIMEDGEIDEFLRKRYSGFESGIGKKIHLGETTLEELADFAEGYGANPIPESGRQEEIQGIINRILFTR